MLYDSIHRHSRKLQDRKQVSNYKELRVGSRRLSTTKHKEILRSDGIVLHLNCGADMDNADIEL